MIRKKKGVKFLNACLLIIGTSVGAGMLGMPVETSQGGYLPSLAFLLISWFASLLSALFFVKALNQIKKSVNFSSLAEIIIGKASKIYILLIYLLLFLSLIFAYAKGGGIFVTDIFPNISTFGGTLLFLGILFPFIIKGAGSVGKINSLLTLPMGVSFILLLILGTQQLQISHLSYVNWKFGFLSLPIMVTAFGFHGIIPSLFKYLNYSTVLTRRSIIIGSFVTLMIYILWQTYILGIIPLNGEVSLTSALSQDQTAISPLRKILGTSSISHLAEIFYFCALTTSFLGVSLGLTDFLIDAFRIRSVAYNKFVILILIFIPALLLSGTNLRIFYLSLKYGSGLACSLLLILFPSILMLKILKKNDLFKFNILKIALGIAFIYSFSVIYSQLLGIFGS